MGDIYEVRGDALSNRLALKVVRPELANDPDFRARFEREARIQSQLVHPSIGRVFDLIAFDGHLAIVMEFIDAPTLREVLAAGPVAPADARAIATELAAALLAAHEAQVVHRDIKPENLFITRDRLGRVGCKLIDFGVAKGAPGGELYQTAMAGSRSFVGTFAYASPEQVTGELVADHRSDLYSLGVVLWEMLSGVRPYGHLDSAFSVQTAVVNEPLPDLPDECPEDLQRLVVELTRKSPDERPQSAEEVVALLGEASRAPVASASASASSSFVAATVVQGSSHGVAAAPRLPPSALRPPTGRASGGGVGATSVTLLLLLSSGLVAIGLIPCFGWLNWLAAPLCAVPMLGGLLGLLVDRDAETGRARNVAGYVMAIGLGGLLAMVSAVRCAIGGGVI